MPTRLEAFADAHDRRVAYDNNPTPQPILPGADGLIYDWDDGQHLAVMVFGAHVTPRTWNMRRRKCVAAGMEVMQNGDAEGTLRFDPGDAGQAAAACDAIRLDAYSHAGASQEEQENQGLPPAIPA